MKYNIRRPLTVEERNAFGDYSDILSHLLFHRGHTNRALAEAFVEPNYDIHTHDPFLLKDAEKSADRIIQAVKNKEKIAIYSDYDADGIPAAVMFHDFFTRIGYKNFIVYIPHRHNEGFGLNKDAVTELAGQGVKLIITLDCGITDVLPVIHANEKGVQVIITDHHEPPAELPPAYAIVDHKQKDCLYPDKNLCGSGVGFKLIQAILKKDRLGIKDGHEKWLLDMVGIATLSDMVSLTGENRVFAYYGLHVLRNTPRKGLVRLLDKLKISRQNLTEDDIGFMITPRINAASRMGAPMDAFKLLTSNNDIDADVYADHLDHINNERKGIVASLVKEIKKTINERYAGKIPNVIVLGNPEWRPSLLGLVANTCAEEFDRPVFLWGRDGDNMIKGSCRSEGRSNIVEIMRAVKNDVFDKFGGHHHSGGFEVSGDHVHNLDKYLNDAYDLVYSSLEKDSEKTFTKNIDPIDHELSFEDVDENLYKDIYKLAPFGISNSKPVFLFKNLTPISIRKFGKTNNHLELVFKKKNGTKLSAISFFDADAKWVGEWKDGQNIDLVASIEKSFFRGRPELRLRVVDVIINL
jgi:single-stranded-DNA-specific exonuclease